jgi:hypothetical protein
VPRRPSRSQLRAVAAIVVAGTFALAANVAAGLERGQPSPIPDLAFRPVELSSLPPSVADAQAVDPAQIGVPAATPRLVPLGEPFPPSSVSPVERARPALPAPRAIVVTPPPKYTHSLSGPASYYCYAGSSPCTSGYPDGGGFQAYAAAGPKLRAAIGSNWRGKVVSVDGIRVKLIDWCQCYKGESNEKLLDLYHDVFARTGSHVTIRW